ncbi:glycosyltransferase family 4 protein [Halorubrum distributum]|uniref:glycosyltransferase family 4 protein n=1 Tax=Halorubrum distributum TaxID=29283 RepID=UPI002953EAB7|nr:glycosyltransferase family 4 protein [Halorubrum distributum]MDV7349641.1 glycosyltransferase family 4 protein [Halorubrum distributum]
MKLLLFVDWTFPCDHQFLTEVYAKRFQEMGHEVTWVMRGDDTGQPPIQKEVWNGSAVYLLSKASYDPIRISTQFFTNRIQNHCIFNSDIQLESFDLIHVRNDLAMGLLALHISDEINIPYTHQISHLKAESLIQSNNMISTEYIKGQLGKKLRNYISQSADLILPISDAMQDYLHDQGYSTQMKTLPTGSEINERSINSDQFLRKYSIDSRYILLYIGSMSPLRNLDFLFDVVGRVLNEYDVELVMAGGRSERNVDQLRNKAKEKKVSHAVTFTGWISDRDMIKQAISASDIGYSPLPPNTILRMNAPIKTLEYMSLGTPVIASDTPDQQNVLQRSRGGIATAYNVDEFAESTTYLLKNKKIRERMGDNGHAYIKNNRNFDVLSRQVERYYMSLIEDHRKGVKVR